MKWLGIKAMVRYVNLKNLLHLCVSISVNFAFLIRVCRQKKQQQVPNLHGTTNDYSLFMTTT